MHKLKHIGSNVRSMNGLESDAATVCNCVSFTFLPKSCPSRRFTIRIERFNFSIGECHPSSPVFSRSLCALVLSSTGWYVSGTKKTIKSHWIPLQMRRDQNDHRLNLLAPLVACLTHCIIYQLAYWLMNPPKTGPRTGPLRHFSFSCHLKESLWSPNLQKRRSCENHHRSL